MSLRRILIALSTVALVSAGAIAAPRAEADTIGPVFYPGGKCKNLGGFSYVQYYRSSGAEAPASRNVAVRDFCKDGKSIIVRFWLWVPEEGKYLHFQDVWNSSGANKKTVIKQVTMPPGDRFRAKICQGDWPDRSIDGCAPGHTYSPV